MEHPPDYFAWCRKLECPPEFCTETVKKRLRKGLLEMLWDDTANATYTTKEATVIRKNILLHKLKNKIPDRKIQCVKELSRLKAEEDAVKNKVATLEKEYKRQEFLVRQKVEELKNIRTQRAQEKVRKDLLKLKYDQTSTQVQDCMDMRRVCQNLMPSTSTDFDPEMAREMLDVVKNLGSRETKKQVFDKIYASLGHIEILTLWRVLYQNLIEDVDRLIKSEEMKNTDFKPFPDKLSIEISKLCGEHICLISKRLEHENQVVLLQQAIVEYIEKIETASVNCQEISECLALTLEVKKLEVEQKVLQNEIQNIQEEIQENSSLPSEYIEVTSEIQKIRKELKEYVTEVRQSLSLLKCSGNLIRKLKDKLYLAFEKILPLHVDNYDIEWQEEDLIKEVDMFYYNLDINALRKIMLKGDIGLYRHTKFCFNETSITISPSQGSCITSYFPMIQTPIYTLIECYTHLIGAAAIQKLNSPIKDDEFNSEETQIAIPQESNYNTMELLSLARNTCDSTREHINEFNDILSSWIHQPVQEAMQIIETKVDGASFADWYQRFNLLLYMIQNSKQ